MSSRHAFHDNLTARLTLLLSATTLIIVLYGRVGYRSGVAQEFASLPAPCPICPSLVCDQQPQKCPSCPSCLAAPQLHDGGAKLSAAGQVDVKLPADFTLKDLEPAAAATGYTLCKGIPMLMKLSTRPEDGYRLPFDSTLSVTSEIPCREKRAEGGPAPCINHDFYFRYNTTDYIVYAGVFVHHFFSHIYGLLDKTPPKYILDAGANAGFTTVLFNRLFPEAIVVSVEPDDDNYAQVMKNTQGLKGVHVVKGGLWGWTANITVARKYGEWGYVFQETEKGEPGTPAYSVQDLMRVHSIPAFDFVKLDIEGAEGMVFDPKADTSWVRNAKFVVAEVHGRFAEHFNLTPAELESRFYSAFDGLTRHVSGEHELFFAPGYLTP